MAWWQSIRSDADAEYDDVVVFQAEDISPTVTWGITPEQGIGVNETIPTAESLPEDERQVAEQAYQYMQLQPGQAIKGTPVDVCFVGSCTNGRISDLREAAKYAKGHQVATGIKALIIPASEEVKQQAEAEEGDRISASSSNRNFKGRQGSKHDQVMANWVEGVFSKV